MSDDVANSREDVSFCYIGPFLIHRYTGSASYIDNVFDIYALGVRFTTSTTLKSGMIAQAAKHFDSQLRWSVFRYDIALYAIYIYIYIYSTKCASF